MNAVPGNKVLFVDDEPSMREIMAMLLNDEGYDVSTASDGLDALSQLRVSAPDLIISDINMPRMSGLEFLSVVRRRFPAIPVIAISGSYDINDGVPPEVMADAFYPKSRCNPDELMRCVAYLLGAPVARPTNYRPVQPPAVQLARSVNDSSGHASPMLICSDCLRTFSLRTTLDNLGVHETQCPFCAAQVSFMTHVSLERVSLPILDVCAASNSSSA